MGRFHKSSYHNKTLFNARKEHQVNGLWQNRIGSLTRLTDKNGNDIHVGDIVRYDNGRNWKHKSYTGRVFWNDEQNVYGICFGMWYGNDEFDTKSYGKFIRIPSDNGGRMNFEVIKYVNENLGGGYYL